MKATATASVGSVSVAFYTTPEDAQLPGGLIRLSIFHTWTARRLVGALTGVDGDGYTFRIWSEAKLSGARV